MSKDTGKASESHDGPPTRADGPESVGVESVAGKYREALIRFCYGYLGQMDDAEDAVQEVLLKVHEAELEPGHIRAWLYKVARNHCLNVLRGRARRRDDQAIPSGSIMAGAWTGQLTRLVRSEARSRIAHLIAALPQSYREALRLRYVDGLSRAEIAEVLEVSASVVKSRLCDGLNKLRVHASMLS